MRTELLPAIKATASGARAEEILRNCVHCGFCNATCPTYQLVGDELDGPRGRIYLIKELLETGSGQAVTARHLDRCLTCRSCETTCPSGVAYGELLEIGREYLEPSLRRGILERFTRKLLVRVVPDSRLFRFSAHLGHAFRWLLPSRLRQQLPRVGTTPSAGPPATKTIGVQPAEDQPGKDKFGKDKFGNDKGTPVKTGNPQGRVLLLVGCVQQVSTPEVNAALRRILADRGIEVVTLPGEVCCGSLALHLGDREPAEMSMRRNLAALNPLLPQVDAVISTASGCGVTLKDYPRLLSADADATEPLRLLAEKMVDASEYLASLDTRWRRHGKFKRVAWHAPCTLQHGQKISGKVERILRSSGYVLLSVRDAHLCCGSAGTYALLQPSMAEQLREQKIRCLTEQTPDVIATANVGCQLHLERDSQIPVHHWIELIR